VSSVIQPNQLSLRRRILYKTAPLAFILLLLASIYPVRRVSQELAKQIESQISAEALHLADSVDRKIANSVEACAAVAHNDIVVNAIIDNEHRNSTLRSFIRSIQLPGANVQDVVMTDYRGTAIASKSLKTDQKRFQLGPKRLAQVMAGESVVAIDGSTLMIVQPVRYSGHPEATICATYRVADFFSDLCVGTDTSVSTINYGGTTIISSETKGNSEARSASSMGSWLSETCSVQSIHGLSATVMKSNTLALEATNAVRLALLFQTVAALAIITVGLWRATSMATSSITDFITAIDDVRSNANLGRRVSFNSSAEFIFLGDRFNAMLEEIQKSTVSREEYRMPALVAKYTDNAVVVTDPQGVVVWVNEGFTRMTGYSSGEAIGRKPGSFLQGPSTSPESIDQMRLAIRENRGVNVEILNYHKSGDPYWVALEIRPIIGDDGNVINFIAIETNITDRIEAEKEKENLNRQMVGLSRQAGMAEVATGVLHNVGNALNSVNISVDLLTQRLASTRTASLSKAAEIIEQHETDLTAFFQSDRGRQFPLLIRKLTDALESERSDCMEEAERLRKSVAHIKQIVKKQQNHARGSHHVLAERLQLDLAVDEALRIRSELIEEHQVIVTTDYDDAPDAWADRHLVIEILVNLIGNAVNAVDQNVMQERSLAIKIHADGEQHVQIAVSDNGIGIQPEHMKKIFSHGFTTRDEGHGFGLHSSILAAESMGGTIAAKSAGRNCGATFSLRLPCVAPSTADEVCHA
jgi:PAS domain S-box-containing protein